jgi:hypothetical protein
MKRRIVPGAILALSLAVALLAATASSASFAPGGTSGYAYARWVCSLHSTPTIPGPGRCSGSPGQASFDFGYHLVGTSTSQLFELVVRGDWRGDTFSPRIGVAGEYAQTNNCPPTLSAAAYQNPVGCQITVTFTPTDERTGPRPGTLTTGPGGPTMALTGNGEPRDSVPPDLRLSGPKKQSPQDDYPGCDGHHCNVEITVSCGDEWCTARATGRLTIVKQEKLSPGGPSEIKPGTTRHDKVGPELRRGSQRKQVRKALAEGKNVMAKVTVDATDSSGNVATAKRTIRLVK